MGGEGQLDLSQTGNVSAVTSTHIGMFAIAVYALLDSTDEWFPTKWPQSPGKIVGMSQLLT